MLFPTPSPGAWVIAAVSSVATYAAFGAIIGFVAWHKSAGRLSLGRFALGIFAVFVLSSAITALAMRIGHVADTLHFLDWLPRDNPHAFNGGLSLMLLILLAPPILIPMLHRARRDAVSAS